MPTKQEVNNAVAETYQGPGQGPEGIGIGGALSFRRLNELAGPLAKDTGEPQLCGWITGFVQGVNPPETGDYGEFQRIIGDFWGKAPTGDERTATELFLPMTTQRFVEAALRSHGPGVPIRFEGWAYPDPDKPGKKKNGAGYLYRVFLRERPGIRSAARQLAEQVGIVAPPPAPPPLSFPQHDLETGEIAPDEIAPDKIAGGMTRMVAGQPTKDGLADMLGSSRDAGQRVADRMAGGMSREDAELVEAGFAARGEAGAVRAG